MFWSVLLTSVIVSQVAATPVPLPNPALRLFARQSSNSSANKYANWPNYTSLPLQSTYPFKAAWGVWGSNDQYGALNHITNQTILNAAKSEILLGRAINLNLNLDDPFPPFNPNRRPLSHAILPFSGYNDDSLTLNTQISTQYDGLRHFPYSTDGNTTTYQFYNNLLTFAQLMDPSQVDGPILGIQNSANYGVAGRGVLFDWAGWMESTGRNYSALSNRSIPVSELQQVADWQGLNLTSAFRDPGAWLVVRTGVTKAYRNLTTYQQQTLPYRPGNDGSFVGVETSDATLSWIWDKKISLVGSDNPAFEALPFGNAAPSGQPSRSLHQVFISGWGQSIVELLDLEVLAAVCAQQKRYTFFFTIQNLNVLGGVASPPNAMAIM